MKIAIVSPEYPPYTNWGGTARFNKNLTTLLTNMGHTVEVITFDGEGKRPYTKNSKGITIHYVPFQWNNYFINLLYFKFPFGIFRMLLSKFLPEILFLLEWNFFSLIYFIYIYKKNKYNVIHAPTYMAPTLFLSLVFRKIPLIIHSQGPQNILNLYEVDTASKRIKAWLEDTYMIYFSNAVIPCSKDIMNNILKDFPSIADKTTMIYNFTDTSVFKNTLSVNTSNIVFMGRLEYRKGIDLLVKSFIQIAKVNEKVNLWIIGKNGIVVTTKDRPIDFYSWLENENLPHSIRKRIFLLDRIDDQVTLTEFLKKIKGIAVFLSRYEPFGFVTVEAMALGYIVVTTPHGGGKEIIENARDGYLVNLNLYQITKLLNELVHLPQSKSTLLTKNAQNKCIKLFDNKVVEKKYIELYKKMLLL